MNLKFSIFLVVFSLIISCKKESELFTNISTSELKAIIEKGDKIQLLDVRTSEECKNGLIKDAINISVTNDGFTDKSVNVLEKNKPVYVYCRSGGRSVIASKILANKGFKVFNIEGGYKAWQNEQ